MAGKELTPKGRDQVSLEGCLYAKGRHKLGACAVDGCDVTRTSLKTMTFKPDMPCMGINVTVRLDGPGGVTEMGGKVIEG